VSAQDQSGGRGNWTRFLFAAVASVTIWNGLYFFAFYDWALTNEAAGPLLLLVPFVALLLLAYFLIWRLQKSILARGLSVVAAIWLPVGIAMLVARLHAMVYPVHFYGIP
jgi:uncharacterized membrane protein